MVGNAVDIGAYEFQGPGGSEFIGWLQQFGLPTNGSADSADTDSDGLDNYQEWRADTNPTNALSALRMLTVTNGAPGLVVSWESMPTRGYSVERTGALSAPGFSAMATIPPGQLGSTSFADPTATNRGPYFYRAGVQP